MRFCADSLSETLRSFAYIYSSLLRSISFGGVESFWHACSVGAQNKIDISVQRIFNFCQLRFLNYLNNTLMASLLICWSTLFLAGLVLGMQSCEHKSCLILLVGQVSNDQARATSRRLLLD